MPDRQDLLRYTPPPRLKLIGIVAACVVAAVVVFGLISRSVSSHTVSQWTEANSEPTVSVIDLAADRANGQLVLPGDVQAYQNAPIYARVSGYLRKWYADIGTPVKAGQLLAEIDVPDQDQQLAQAKADLGTAVANQRLSAATAARWNRLLKENAAAPQDVDEKNGDLAAKNAAVASAKANVDRLADLEVFKRITAPFDGVVTSRATDVGQLVNIGTTGAVPLFTVADESKVRIYVNVPQNYSAQVRPGMKATFTVPEYPGRVFTATLIAAADSVSATTGTSIVQLEAGNADRALKPGDYAQVKFDLAAHNNIIQVPASALLFRDTGMAVVTLGAGNRVAIKPIVIGRDLGTTVEVASGLAASDRVIDNPPDSIRAGDHVRLAGK
ncbi:MAG TPA: efflux RND transporter periplasmic adaptor subunit [Rhizomicrobium sp.]|jgi:RND family efflux transporter MFP subunit|nr:efflux RND transporter periplasmic adaptor subunit [Rhizomicrobium sp.]